MGFPYPPGMSKDDIISERLKKFESDSYVNETLSSTLIGNILWEVRRWQNKTENNEIIYIVCLVFYQGAYDIFGEDGYPPSYNCPLEFLEMAPVCNQVWRNKVRAYHSSKKNEEGMYQLRGGQRPQEDTGELRFCQTLEEAMELFLIGGWWKLSYTRPNGHRVCLVRDDDIIEITYL